MSHRSLSSSSALNNWMVLCRVSFKTWRKSLAGQLEGYLVLSTLQEIHADIQLLLGKSCLYMRDNNKEKLKTVSTLRNFLSLSEAGTKCKHNSIECQKALWNRVKWTFAIFCNVLFVSCRWQEYARWCEKKFREFTGCDVFTTCANCQQ